MHGNCFLLRKVVDTLFDLEFARPNTLIRVSYFILFYADVSNDNIVLLQKKCTRRIFFFRIYSQNSGTEDK